MQQYIARRCLQSVLALWVMSLVVFGLARISGNPLDVLLPFEAGPQEYAVVAHHWGLDRPLYVQYGIFVGKALQGDFGNSWLWQGHSVMNLVAQRLPATLKLAGIALAISVVIALPIGVLAAVMKDTPVDSMAKTIALLGQSLPAFWLGIVLMWIFAVRLGWLPPSGDDGAGHYVGLVPGGGRHAPGALGHAGSATASLSSWRASRASRSGKSSGSTACATPPWPAIRGIDDHGLFLARPAITGFSLQAGSSFWFQVVVVMRMPIWIPASSIPKVNS